MDVFQTMTEMRAMRRLKPDPVPENLIRDVIRYATHAPSGGNAQDWRFIVVTDLELRTKIGDYYRQAVDFYLAKLNTAPQPHQTRDEWERMVRAVRWQGDHVGEAPVLIFPSLTNLHPKTFESSMGSKTVGGSIYPAIQNLLLACRALGLGATLTSLHLRYETEINELLSVPANGSTFAMIPVGWSTGRFGPTKRTPVDAVIGWNGWDTAAG